MGTNANDIYNRLITHVFQCEECVSTGVNCTEANEMATQLRAERQRARQGAATTAQA